MQVMNYDRYRNFFKFSCSLCKSIQLEIKRKTLNIVLREKKLFMYTKMSNLQLFDANVTDEAIQSTSFSSKSAVPGVSAVPCCD